MVVKKLQGKRPCWRRGEKIERFKYIMQELVEMPILDDPSMASIDPEDMKAWYELIEAGSGDARYSDMKYTLNAPRSLLNNDIDFAAEPAVCDACTPADFWKMVSPMYGHLQEAHPIFKRCVSIIGGKEALYVRLPSENADQEIFRFSEDDVAKDWLMGDHKACLSSFRLGIHQKYEGYDEAVEREDAWVMQIMGAAHQPAQVPVTDIPASSTSFGAPDVERVTSDADASYRFSVTQLPSGAAERSKFKFHAADDALTPSLDFEDALDEALSLSAAGQVATSIVEADAVEESAGDGLGLTSISAADLAEEMPPKRFRVSRTPRAIQLLEAGCTTAAEGTALEAYMQAGLKWEEELKEASQYFARHAAAGLGTEADAAMSPVDAEVDPAETDVTPGAGAMRSKSEASSPEPCTGTFGVIDLTWDDEGSTPAEDLNASDIGAPEEMTT